MSQKNHHGSAWSQWRACGWAAGAAGCLFAAASFAAWAPEAVLRQMPGEDAGWQHAAFQIGDYMEAPVASAREARRLALGTIVYRDGPASFLPASLDTVSHRSQEIECLALNIYFEARGESDEGQRAVAHVVMNRVADPSFPSSACAVIREGGTVDPGKCQFTWWCDRHANEPRNMAAWQNSQAIAEKVYDAAMGLQGESDVTGGALWYHADYVSPDWSFAFAPGPRIGRHLFYRKAPEGSRTATAKGRGQSGADGGIQVVRPVRDETGPAEARSPERRESKASPAETVKRRHHVFADAPSEATAIRVAPAGG